MLDYMRKNAGSWIIKIMLGGIVLVFVFWGIGPSGLRTKSIITIGKTKVPYSEYQTIYNNLLDSYRQLYKNMDSKTLDSLDLKERALNGLEERYLLLRTAKQLHISATPDEVAAQIASTAAFQENGVFVPQRYQAYLEFKRIKAKAYESSLANDIVIKKVSDLLTAPAVVTEQEVDDSLQLLTRQAIADVLVLTPNDFVKSVPPATEDQLKNYFEKNRERYRVPEQFRVSAAVIDPVDFRQKVVVSTQDMKDLYEDMKPEFTKPAAFHIRHILFSIPENASAESIKAIRTRAEDITDQIREKKISFSEAARKYSDDKETAAKGGDLGFVEKNQMYSAVWDAIADLDEGEITDPIPTPKGFEVSNLIAFREKHLQSFDEVKDKLESRLRQEDSVDLAYDMADDILDKVYASKKPLADIAEDKGLLVIKTPLFSRDEDLGKFQLPEEVLKYSFNMEEGETGDVFEKDGKLFLYQVTERNDPYLPELDAVRDKVKSGLLIQRALDLALDKAEDLLAKLKKGQSMNSLAASLGKKAVRTDPFTVMDKTLPGLEDAEQIIEAAFSIQKPGGGAVVSGHRTRYLVSLEKFIEPEKEELTKMRPTVKQALQAQKEKEILDGYLAEMKEKLKDQIVIHRDLI